MTRRTLCLVASWLAPVVTFPGATSAQELLITGAPTQVANTTPACPEYDHQSDGSWPVLPSADGSETLIFWGNHRSHRSHTTNFFGSNWQLSDGQPANSSDFFVIGEGVRGFWGPNQTWQPGDHDNGGAWLYNVHRVGTTLYGFYHSEDHDWPGYSGEWPPDTSWIPWASCALAKSTDDGLTWTKLGQRVATDKLHPPIGFNPNNYGGWGGTGGNTVRFDHINNRWVMMYHSFSWGGGPRIAATLDANPEGPFFKYHNGSFSEPGFLPSPNPDRRGGSDSLLDGLRDHPGTSPNLHWNTYLGKWVVVFHDQAENRFYFATCADLMTPIWSSPKPFMTGSPTEPIRYPCVIGGSPLTSYQAGQTATLIYARVPVGSPNGYREPYRVPITFNMNPNADFVASATKTPIARPVQFTDLSTNQPTSWQWDFDGNGTIDSTAQNPTWEYAQPGTYTVTLTAANSWLPTGNLEVKTAYVVAGIPETDFRATPRAGVRDLAVTFADLSTAAPTSWSWTFGDGSASTAQNPSHTYTVPGTYDVTLTATNNMGFQTVTKAGHVQVGAQAAPVAGFSAYPRYGGVGMTTQFTDTSTNTPSNWVWDFGDGQASTEQNPVHQYTAPGIYTVGLMAMNAHGNHTVVQTGLVLVAAAPTTTPVSSSFNSFSLTQNGAGNWWYYEWDGSHYAPMTAVPAEFRWIGTGTDAFGVNSIYSSFQTSTRNQCARAYVVQHAGRVRIRTRPGAGIGHLNDKGGDGFTAIISRASSLDSLGETVWQKYYRYDDSSANLDTLDFTVDAKQGDVIVFRSEMGSGWGWDSMQVQMELEETWGGAPPVAAFVAATPTSGVVWHDVTFDSSGSSADVSGYAWDFDSDGVVDSTEANPTFRYKYPGAYDVTLTVYGTYGINVLKRPGYITAMGLLTFESIAAEDGYIVQGSGPGNPITWNATDSSASGLSAGDTGNTSVVRSIVSFATGPIPDGAVLDVVQVLLTNDVTDGNPDGLAPLLLDIKTGTFGTAALQGSDFAAAATITASLPPPVGPPHLPIPGEPITFGLNAAERAAINKTGKTQMRVRWTTTTNGDAIADSLGFCPGEFANANKRPKLVVKYH